MAKKDGDRQGKAGKPDPNSGLAGFGRMLGRSCYNMEFYRSVRIRPWTEGLFYFLKLMAVVTLVVTAVAGPAIYGGLDKLRQYVTDKVPDSGSLTLSGGQLAAVLPMPVDFSSGPEERFILDTSVVGLDVPRERIGDNGVLIGRDAIFMRSSGTEDRIHALKDLPSFSVNKRSLLGWLDRFILPIAVGLTLLVAVFTFLAESVGYLTFILMAALFAMLLSRFWKVSLEYSKWLAVSLHAVTLPLILASAFDLLGWNRVPVFPVVFFMILASVMADERASGTIPPEKAPTVPDGSKPPFAPLEPPDETGKQPPKT
jgi:hypothetical protein